jgi:hypothetical protein
MASAAVYAAPTNIQSPVHAMYAKTQTVKLALRNDSGSQLQVKVGEQVMSIDAGKIVALKVPVGTRIVLNAATSTRQAGELIAEVNSSMDNATVSIK